MGYAFFKSNIQSERTTVEQERINKVEILDSGELLLALESGGKSEYQYVYREAAGVYWDNELKGFKSTIPTGEWTYSQWFSHIVDIVKTGVGVEISLANEVVWGNIPEQTKTQILSLAQN